MLNLIFKIFFVFFSIFVLLKSISYALYEINTEKNKTGGIAVISLSIFITIFSNVILFFK